MELRDWEGEESVGSVEEQGGGGTGGGGSGCIPERKGYQ